MWTWIKAKWAAFLVWGKLKDASMEAKVKAEREELEDEMKQMEAAVAERFKRRNAQPPATDAHVGIGSTRFSDGLPQTPESLAAAQGRLRDRS